MGVAHHSAYVAWLEEARIAALRARGISYRELEAQGVFMPVTELHIRYRRSLRFDDAVAIATTVVATGPSTVQFASELRLADDDKLIASAVVTVATVNVLMVGRSDYPLPCVRLLLPRLPILRKPAQHRHEH